MHNEKVQSLIVRILETAYKITTQTETTVFCNYMAHINVLQVQVYNNGWVINAKKDSNIEIVLEPSYQAETFEEIINSLEECYEYLRLIELKEEK